ncbi:MAG: ABC transporter ATP-binding protein [Promethearchaeota archaeon]|jgi:oligopeptide/dipeptide ABC transporter ATP-binding protein
MINMLFQYYFANYGLNFIESLACIFFIYFFAILVSKPLLEKADELKKKKIRLSLVISILIAFGIGLGAMFTIAYIGWYVLFFRWINTIYFNFALMTTLVFPFYKIFLNRTDKSLLSSSESRRIFLKRYLVLFVVSWIVVGLFVSFDLLGIPIGNLIPDDSISPTYDIFLLGLQWTFFGLIIYSVLTILILRVIPLDKRPPKDVINNSILFGALIAFGVWSIQLIVVELFVSRFFGITIYQQDIRVLAIVVAIIFFGTFLVSMKYKFLPKAVEADRLVIQEEVRSMEGESQKIIDDKVILKVENLVTNFFTEEGVVHAVEGVSFEIYEGEVLGLVGETGCGKSVTALSILQLLQSSGKILNGKVEFEGEDLLKKSISEILSYRGDKITMIFQDPLNSLNPVNTVGKQISEVYILHKKKELLIEASTRHGESIYSIAREWSEQLLRDLNIPSPENVIDRYPHELSGGMRQRIQIAMGIAGSPRLLIADEPTTALDVTVQNQILKLMKDLRKKYSTSILFITHDLGIISKMCDRVAVMYSGSIVEYGETIALFTEPYHPYTKGLLTAIPIEGEERDLTIIPGMVPNLIYPPTGCRFHPRCVNRFHPCDSLKPKNMEVAPNYFVACHLYDPQYNLVKEVVK